MAAEDDLVKLFHHLTLRRRERDRVVTRVLVENAFQIVAGKARVPNDVAEKSDEGRGKLAQHFSADGRYLRVDSNRYAAAHFGRLLGDLLRRSGGCSFQKHVRRNAGERNVVRPFIDIAGAYGHFHSHLWNLSISYAVFCLSKKKREKIQQKKSKLNSCN